MKVKDMVLKKAIGMKQIYYREVPLRGFLTPLARLIDIHPPAGL